MQLDELLQRLYGILYCVVPGLGVSAIRKQKDADGGELGFVL